MNRPPQPDREETIVLLREAIERLNGIVSQLNTGSLEKLPPKGTIETLLNTTRQLSESLSAEDDFEGIEEFMTSPVKDTEPERLDDYLPTLEEVESWWDRVLNTVRSLLPGGLGAKIPDRLLTGILTGSVVVVLLLAVISLQGLPNPVEIADNPVLVEPSPTPETEVIPTPEVLRSPDEPVPVTISTPKPRLTPEQSLVAAILEEINNITARFPEGIIYTVEADFSGSQLTVFVEDNWYSLDPAKQDKLAETIFTRSRELDFRDFEMKNTEGVLLARSPVVGNRVVIIERTKREV